ncbi:unnamed protein product [Closterium sp. Yama58-4]|nr:unnamed protein product [Closterium sp. Yama58-4]
MDPKQGSSHSGERKNLKRKLADSACPSGSEESGALVTAEVQAHIAVLKGSLTWREADRVAARKAAHAIAELAKHEEHVDAIVEEGAIHALVPHLSAPAVEEGDGPIACEHEVEKDAAFALGLLAIKPDHQRLIADAGALPALVALLKRRPGQPSAASAAAAPASAPTALDAITNLVHENATIKSRVRAEGGIPPLVELLESLDPKVQRAGAGALRTLAFKNEANKNLIVECGALPTLIFMLRSEDTGIHYEAVGVIGNLVHSSMNIKKLVLDEGALQPVIGLLSSRCTESQREAALLLGQFATTDPECKVRIVQRGAVRPLITMLEAPDPQLREMAAFALGRLAQNADNQAGIVHDGGLRPLLELLESKNGNLQHNAAFALYGLAENGDNVSEVVREGGVQRLVDAELIVQASKDCVQKTLKRLEEKMEGKVLRHLLYLLRQSDKSVQRRVAAALAHLCPEGQQRAIFVGAGGLDILLSMLASPPSPRLQRDAAVALRTLSKRATTLNPIDTAPPPPTPQVYLGEQYVNCPTLSDVTFLVEGTRFYAHRIALLASSDAFRAMFDGGYREEKEAKDIEIPNISLPVFESMMRCIYTGAVEVRPEMAQDLLRAADQYLLETLKRLCEHAIAKDLTVENVANVYELAETYHAQSLRQMCVLFVLDHHEQMCNLPGYNALLQRMVPETREYISRVLRPRLP